MDWSAEQSELMYGSMWRC